MTKEGFKTQETKGKISFLSKNITQKPVLILWRIELIVISILAFICITLPFWHIAFEEGAEDGIFGFTSMRAFLYSFGTHFTLFSCSVFLLLIINVFVDADKQLKTISNIIGGGFCSVSVYYLLFVFITRHKPFPDYAYEIAFISTSILASIVIVKIFKLQFKLRKKIIEDRKASKAFINTALNFIDEINETLVK